MDNLTHTLVGLAAAKAGLERVSPRYATAVCVVAANAPDLDIVVRLAGQWEYLEHHRGITHSLVGTFAIALMLPALFYGGERVRARLRGGTPRASFGGLLLASLLLSASHPLLDWTNSYGVRPLLPWSGRWFYGDLVFILDPWLWLSLGGATFLLTKGTGRRAAWVVLAVVLTGAILFLPQRVGMPYPLTSRLLWLAGLAGLCAARLAGLPARWGRAIPAAALALMIVYWGALAFIHRLALDEAQAVARGINAQTGEAVRRVAAMPVLADPLGWRCVVETDAALHRFDLRVGGNNSVSNVLIVRKPQGADATYVERAGEDARARIFLCFAPLPATRVIRGGAEGALVRFADLRYAEPGGAGRGGFTLEVPVGERGDASAGTHRIGAR